MHAGLRNTKLTDQMTACIVPEAVLYRRGKNYFPASPKSTDLIISPMLQAAEIF